MEQGLKLSKEENEKEIDATRYRKNIGCLRYLLYTRPDLSYVVGVLSRYMQSPRESHGAAMKQVLRYLQGVSRMVCCLRDQTRRYQSLSGTVIVLVMRIQMMVRVPLVIYSILERVQYPSVRRNKIRLL